MNIILLLLLQAIIDNSGALLAECINVLKNKSTFGLASVGSSSRTHSLKETHARPFVPDISSLAQATRSQ